MPCRGPGLPLSRPQLCSVQQMRCASADRGASASRCKADSEGRKVSAGNTCRFSRAGEDAAGCAVETLCIRVALNRQSIGAQARGDRLRMVDQLATEAAPDECRFHEQSFELNFGLASSRKRVEADDASRSFQGEEVHVFREQLLFSI